ncbi:MAG: hypothetical protein WCL13_03630 [bacterium]
MKEQLETQLNEETIVKAVEEKKNFLYSLDKKTTVEIYEKICDLADELEKKYPDARKYYLFHTMINSGMKRQDCSAGFDFSGDDSIAKLIDDLYRKYKTD